MYPKVERPNDRGPWRRPLRRSHEVRSLKIPQGLLQVSSTRSEAGATDTANGRLVVTAHRPGKIRLSATFRHREQRTKPREQAFPKSRTQPRQSCSTSQQHCFDHFEMYGPSQIYNIAEGRFCGLPTSHDGPKTRSTTVRRIERTARLSENHIAVVLPKT
jgi:hypothetical protein